MKPLSQASQQLLRGPTRILQAVSASMIFAVIIGLTVVIGQAPESLNMAANMLVMLGAFTALVSYGLSFVVAAIFHHAIAAEEVPTEPQVKKAIQQVLNSHIIRSVIIEGGIFLNLMVLLLERNVISVVVIGLGLLLLCSLLPTRRRLTYAVSRRLV